MKRRPMLCPNKRILSIFEDHDKTSCGIDDIHDLMMSNASI